METGNTCLTALLNNSLHEIMHGKGPKPKPARLSTLRVLYLCLGEDQRGREPLSMGQTSCGMRTRGSEVQWVRPVPGCLQPWLLFWDQGGETRPFSYCSYNLCIQVFQKIQISTWRHPNSSSQNASTRRSMWFLGREGSCLWPKASPQGASVPFFV